MKFLKSSLLSLILVTSLSATTHEKVTPYPVSITNPVLSEMLDRTAFKCEGKRTCGQMDSCKEAYFYLKTCGLKRLDKDKDGIPCESICGNGR